MLHTDEVTDEEGLVIGPEGVVDAGVPASVGADDVVGGVDGGRGGGDQKEEEEKVRDGR